MEIERLSLSKSDLDDSSPHLQFDDIRREVRSQVLKLRHSVPTRLSESQTRLIRPKLFSIDGSIVLPIEAFEKFAPTYFRRSRRAVVIGGKVHLRGGRYLISSNPTFELRTKLKTYREDLEEGLQEIDGKRHPLFQLAIGDYVKNAAITILNSLLHEEKMGKYRFESISYQKTRADAINYARAAVNFYLSILVGDEARARAAYRILVGRKKVFHKAQELIIERYEGGTFSSRHITRPEAAHPMVIAAAVYNVSMFGPKDIDIIIGMPSGSTELAMAHRFGQSYFNLRNCDLKLLPVSLHSSKQEFDGQNLLEGDLARWVLHNRGHIEGRRVLIVDDNSSTGRTIDNLFCQIRKVNPRNVDIAIAEADVIRSEIDKNNSLRPMVANREVYRYSVNVLPVSKSLKPKRDIKEIFERRKMEVCTASRYMSDNSGFSRRLIGEVYIDLLRESTEDAMARIPSEDIIGRFQKTALSNFAPSDIIYHGERFNSVEHAYQAMKFPSDTWGRVTDKDVDIINRQLARDGESIEKSELPHLFSRQKLSAGGSKRVANYLRRLGYVKENWDEIKVEIMVDLLIQKYATVDLFSALLETGDKYLIEGNTWDDTFWGECGGRGRNMLGRILMRIREAPYRELVAESERIQGTLV